MKHISHYVAARLALASTLAGGLPAIRTALRRRFHKAGHLAHSGEHGLHIAYLGGVALGGGYRFAAIGMLLCMFVAWLCADEGS